MSSSNLYRGNAAAPSLPSIGGGKAIGTMNSTRSLFNAPTPKSNITLPEDIDCREWLAEIGLTQYSGTFLSNLSSDGVIILRRRLVNVRQQDLAKMNVGDFEHQKALIAHIKLVLQHPFNSATRRREVSSIVANSPLPLQHQRPSLIHPLTISERTQTHSSNATNTKIKYSSSPSKHTQRAVVSEFSGSSFDALDNHRDSSNNNKNDNDDTSAIGDSNSVGGSVRKAVSNTNINGANNNSNNSNPNPMNAVPTNSIPVAKRDVTTKEKQAQRKQNARRRRSFDSQIWSSITSMRNKQSDIAAAAENLREGILPSLKSKDEGENGGVGGSSGPNSKSKNAKRRHSFDPEGAARANGIEGKDKAVAYGNMALEYDMMLSSLKLLQSEYLNKFRGIIGCEKASIFFINEYTHELVLFTDTGEYFRIPPGSGIAGACAISGVCINVPDAYADPRFNRNLDIRTGFHTRNILCQPVRRSRGGGHIAAVVQMINKDGGADFGPDDEEVLAACAQRVGDVLSDRFVELQQCAERFLATATYVGGGKQVIPHSSNSLSSNPNGMSVSANSSMATSAPVVPTPKHGSKMVSFEPVVQEI